MKIMLVHNRYRSAAPSGENRVVDREADALARLGHEVVRFERLSDDIERWSAAKKATLPAHVVWSRDARRDLAAALARNRPDVVHIHNTFPLLSPSVLYACRDAGVPAVATIHNYKLACASGDFFRAGKVCHDCAHGPPVPAALRGCYRGSRAATAPVALSTALHRRAWQSLVAAYVFISASQRDLLKGLDLSPERVFVRHNMIPRTTARRTEPEPAVLYAGRLDEAKGLRILMAAWDQYCGTGVAAVSSAGAAAVGGAGAVGVGGAGAVGVGGATGTGAAALGGSAAADGAAGSPGGAGSTGSTAGTAGMPGGAGGAPTIGAGGSADPGGAGEPRLRLVVVGSGPLEDEVAAWASSRPSVELVGQVDADRCAELMSRARAVLLPSAWEETFGLAAIEAMAVGVPPVASAHGSFPELITSEVDGVLFRPNDPAALAAVITDIEARPRRYAAYGDRARATYERRFDPDESVEHLLEIYRYAVAHPR